MHVCIATTVAVTVQFESRQYVHCALVPHVSLLVSWHAFATVEVQMLTNGRFDDLKIEAVGELL